MNNEIMVSILVITYNHEPYIKFTLDGILMQKTCFQYEIIVHDDASTDKTADIIREYEKKHPDMIKPIYQKENQYSIDSERIIAAVMPYINGKYIAYCEGDDFWIDENKLAIQVDFLESTPEYSACAHNEIMYNCMKGKVTGFHGYSATNDVDVKATSENLVSLASLVYRAEYIFNRPDLFYFAHVPIYYWLCINGKVKFLARVMSFYRHFSSHSAYNSRIREDYNFVIEDRFRGVLFCEAAFQYLNDESEKENLERLISYTKRSLFYALHEKNHKRDSQKLSCAEDARFLELCTEYDKFMKELSIIGKFEVLLRCKYKSLFDICVCLIKRQWRSKYMAMNQFRTLKSKGMIPKEWAEVKRVTNY